jgi:uncharacterized membrane protein
MWFIKKKFFTKAEEKHILSAIKEAELASSGEVRVFVESHCKGDIEKRTIEVFKKLKMNMTRERNGVLIYVAMKDRRFAIYGDEGIHQKMGFQFWKLEAATLKDHFVENKIVEGLRTTIISIGQVLKTHFPYLDDDKNELPDNIVYGD